MKKNYEKGLIVANVSSPILKFDGINHNNLKISLNKAPFH